MRTKTLIIAILFYSTNMFAQMSVGNRSFGDPVIQQHAFIPQEAVISIPVSTQSKILSGKLISNISRKNYGFRNNYANTNSIDANIVPKEIVIIYMSEYPTDAQIAQLEAENVTCHKNSWTPPLHNHPLGFFLAEMPVNKILQTLSFGFVKKMDTAEYESFPDNNLATAAIHADDVWTGVPNYTGSGVKVAILDSGIDTSYAGTELPATFAKMDYSNYPARIDDTVANTTTGHGTHVAGSVLGRGYYSTGRTNDDNNGASPFKGSAPSADLVFLKIGGDASSNSTEAAALGAMDAAINIYHADVLSMSYGGWNAHHDGSSPEEQKVDWVYEQGKPFFISAGNNGSAAMHYSGTVGANDSTDFIAVTAPLGGTLTYNLVWYDGSARNDLFMKYYDGSQIEITDTAQYITTESLRGTESKYSEYNHNITVAGTYYIKVLNRSSNSQFFHVYFDNYGYVTKFASPDPFYTIGQPASADHAFAVGAFASRLYWKDSTGTTYSFNGANAVNNIASFSSRGPRVNGGSRKPDICAPGTAIISLKDQNVYKNAKYYTVDDDGTLSAGDAHYYVMQGTSMATPIAAGAAALLKGKNPSATAKNIYDAIIATAASSTETGAIPNDTWGNGKLDISAALNSSLLPVELSSFTASTAISSVQLRWNTATEINNYGFEIERASLQSSSSKANVGTKISWEKIGFVPGAGNSNSPKSYSLKDENLGSGKYSYRLKQIDNDGKFTYSEEIAAEISVVPTKFSLSQNFPNPFNPSTTIEYSIPVTRAKSVVSLRVYNIVGQEIRTLVNETQEPGNYRVKFDASTLAAGMYVYKLQAGDFSAVMKLLLVK